VSEGQWPIVALGELIESIEAGSSFRCRETPPEQGEVGVAKVSAVSWGRYDEEESKTCLDPSRINHDLLIRKGDFLISRANTVELVGACVIAEQVSKQVMLSDKTLRIVFKDPSLKLWVLHFLRSRAGRDQIEALCTGNQESMRNISQRSLRQIELPLAPPEQRQEILAFVDQQLSRADATTSTLQVIQAKLKQARASILKAAVDGRLVETEAELARQTGRYYEDAEELFERVTHEAATQPAEGRKHRDALASIKPSTDESLAEPPEGWGWVRMQDISQLIRNGYSGKPTEKGSVPILRISSVRAMSVDPSDCRRLEGKIQDYEKSIASKGCLLITRYNGNPDLVGVMGLLRSPDPVVHPDKLIRVEIDLPCIDNEWVEIAFNTGVTRKLLRQRIRTTAGQAGISGQDVKQMPIPLPPIREQQRIVAEVERRFSVVDQVEATVNTCLSRCGKLKQAVLKRAFGG
jgi:type I restriction enzyme S subunit